MQNADSGRGQIRATRDQVLAFRLAQHHLSQRLSRGSQVEVAGACGIQNTPPGAAALALHARVTGLTPTDVERALAVDKTLLCRIEITLSARMPAQVDVFVALV